MSNSDKSNTIPHKTHDYSLFSNISFKYCLIQYFFFSKGIGQGYGIFIASGSTQTNN